MAVKYWYKVSNGSDNWATAANWYLGSGGTGGTTTVPTASDDVILNAASGSGTVSIAAAATCNSLTCTGFTGTLAGTSTLAFLNAITLGSSMTLTYTGTATLGAGTCTFTSNGKIVTFNITVNNAVAQFILNDNLTISSTATMTLTSGVIGLNAKTLSVGLFASTGAVARILDISVGSTMYVTGVGTVWNVSGTLFGSSYTTNSIGGIKISDTSSSGKTITHTPTTGTGGYDFRVGFALTGSGTGAYTLTGNFYDVLAYNTGTASIAFGTSNISYLLDFGTSNMNWNNGATTMTFNTDAATITLSPNMTITVSPTLSITNPGTSNYIYTNNNGKAFTAPISISGTGSFSGLYANDTFYTTGTPTLTAGNFVGSIDAYVGTLTITSNTSTRTVSFYNLYLTGTGALISAITITNLTFSVTYIYVTNSSATAKTLTLSTTIYPGTAVYLGGSGSGAITLAAGTSNVFLVYVTNTGAAAISFSTATIAGLEFSVGTNAVWTNAASQTLTIGGNLTIASSAGSPTLTPALIFNGTTPTYVVGGYYYVYINFNGKSLVTGAVTVNDTAFGANNIYYVFDGFSSNSTFAITTAASVTFNGPFSGTTYTSTSCGISTLNSTLTLTGGVSLANNAYDNSLYVAGTASFTTLAHSGYGTVTTNGPTNITTSIVLNNATVPSTLINNNTLTTPIFTITNGSLTSNSTLNVTGALTLTTGTIQVNGSNNYNIGTFVSSGSTVRSLTMGNGIWTLNGTVGATASFTIWNLVATNLGFSPGASTINIVDSSSNQITFAGGSLATLYNNVQFNRAGSTASIVITGSNIIQNFIDIGTATHSILFTAATTQTIYGSFNVVGGISNMITLNSTTTAVFTLNKFPLGLVNCDYLNIQHCVATPSNTWYAGTNSVNNQATTTAGSGWIFTNIPPRKLGAGGVG